MCPVTPCPGRLQERVRGAATWRRRLPPRGSQLPRARYSAASLLKPPSSKSCNGFPGCFPVHIHRAGCSLVHLKENLSWRRLSLMYWHLSCSASNLRCKGLLMVACRQGPKT